MRITAGPVATPVADRTERMRDGIAVLCALLVGTAFASPLAFVPFFESHDGLVHLWRIWEYARTAQVVGPFVRWAPDIAYGFGAPQFTFYNPLPYAIGALLVTFGSSAGDATKWLFALSIVGSALSAYWLGAAWPGRYSRLAGLCAALIYTSAPYRIATVYQRGALAEAIGCAIAPLVVLAALRIGQRSEQTGTGWVAAITRNGRPIAFLGIATAGVVLAHTIAALLTLPFAGLIGLAVIAEVPRTERRNALIRLFFGFALGLSLSAYYWFPAFSQQSTVHLERARWSGETYRFVSGFAWPWQLVQPSVVHDYQRDVAENRAQAERFPRMGGAATVLLVAGVGLGLASGRLRRPTGLIAIATAAVSIALASPLAIPVWERVDLLASVQLGWRFLSLVMIAAIPIAASLVDIGPIAMAFKNGPKAFAAIGFLLAILCAAGAIVRMPVHYLHWAKDFERPFELNAFERKTGEFALGALREYVPRWTTATPEDLTYRENPEITPENVELQVQIDRDAAANGLRRYDLTASAATTVVFDAFHHPAIGVKIEGRFVESWPTGDDGLVTFNLPSGRHSVELTPRMTLNDRVGSALAAFSLIVLIALFFVGGPWLTSAPGRSAIAVAGAIALGILLMFVPGRLGLASGLEPGVSSRTVIGSTPIALGPDLRVVAAVAELDNLSNDGIVRLDLHLLARRAFDQNLPLQIEIVDDNGRSIARAIGGPGGGFRPTTRWRPNELLIARSELRVPREVLPGHYRMRAEFNGYTAEIGELSVTPMRGHNLPLSPVVANHESIFGNRLVLDGYVHPSVLPVDRMHGSFWWRWPNASNALALTSVLRLVDKQGNIIATNRQAIGGNGSLRPNADFDLTYGMLPSESYRLELLVLEQDAPLLSRTYTGPLSEALILTWFDVRDPCNCLPTSLRRTERRFGDGIVLEGVETRRAGDDLSVSIFWRADRNPSENYTLFLHILDGDRTVAQIDSEPNAGRRATGTWQPGEIIRDHYRVRLPSWSVTALRLGLYRSSNGTRLTLEPPTPDNAVTIPLQIAP